MIVTATQLKQLGACPEAIITFRKLFGEDVEVTEEGCLAVANKFDWTWAAKHLLPSDLLAKYKRVTAPAKAKCDRVTAPAWAEYERVEALTEAEYKRVVAPVWAKYERVIALARAEYKRVVAPALAEYRRVEAQTFARLYIEPFSKGGR